VKIRYRQVDFVFDQLPQALWEFARHHGLRRTWRLCYWIWRTRALLAFACRCDAVDPYLRLVIYRVLAYENR
jgi:hypothetical protein